MKDAGDPEKFITPKKVVAEGRNAVYFCHQLAKQMLEVRLVTAITVKSEYVEEIPVGKLFLLSD